jgi:predicted acylesterase/phospholipase RssA
MSRIDRLLILIISTVLLGGCVGLPRRYAVPAALTTRAITPGVPASRYWPDIDPRPLFRDSLLSVDRELHEWDQTLSWNGRLPPAHLLALSGGGDAGAFGAGLLVGWTAQGSRPQFKIVTGISAGALIAPFAFLGPDYDEVLQKVCGSIGPKDIFHLRNLASALTGDGFADDGPLAALIARYVTPSTLAGVAREYAKGRLLLIGTTNLDARQRVVWNMGEIASSTDPRALTLFRQIMLASTAIPGIFPPVMIDVEVDGRRYQEMHVDGGVMNQVFLLPPQFVRGIEATRARDRRERHVYVIRNGTMEGQWESVSRRTTTVARRALGSLIEAQGVNDLYRLEVAAAQDREEFHFAFIDTDFHYPHKSEFDADYIRHLFQYAYQLAAHGYAWRSHLPNVTQTLMDQYIASLLRDEPDAPQSSSLLALPYGDIDEVARRGDDDQ